MVFGAGYIHNGAYAAGVVFLPAFVKALVFEFHSFHYFIVFAWFPGPLVLLIKD
jgi:hypothetical protein